MGKRVISRARGAGGPRYRSPGHRFVSKPSYAFDGAVKVLDIIHDPARSTPLAKVMTSDNRMIYILAAEGTKVGDSIMKGNVATSGNVLQLKDIPKGSHVYGIEVTPGSGPKLCRSAGSTAIIVNQEPDKTIIKLPSRGLMDMHPNCFATFGMPASAGRKDKKFAKAGQVFWAKRARNKLWPRSSANKMNAVDHPFGGRAHPGCPKSLPKNAPPGQKCGSFGSSRTGRKKR
jgi:large subunit ribosomal protein L2